MTTAPCLQCASEINSEALRCPECGHSPLDDGHTGRKVLSVFGWLLTATLIGAPVGLPLIGLSWWAKRQKKKAGATGRGGM